jgi:hypothetical protein
MRAREIIGGVLVSVIGGSLLLTVPAVSNWTMGFFGLRSSGEDVFFEPQWQLSSTVAPDKYGSDCKFSYTFVLSVQNKTSGTASVSLEATGMNFPAGEVGGFLMFYGATRNIRIFKETEEYDADSNSVHSGPSFFLAPFERLIVEVSTDLYPGRITDAGDGVIVGSGCNIEDRKDFLRSVFKGGLSTTDVFLQTKVNEQEELVSLSWPVLYEGVVLKIPYTVGKE